jgi:hypothetical protein
MNLPRLPSVLLALLALGACSRRVVLPVEPLALRVPTYQALVPQHARGQLPGQLPALVRATPPAPVVPPTSDEVTRDVYEHAYQELAKMLDDRYPLSFKRAVFLTENAYFINQLDYQTFNKVLAELGRDCKLIESQLAPHFLYNRADKNEVLHNAVLFKVLTERSEFTNGRVLTPYSYDFEDFNGEKDWSKMFVSKLLVSHKGNCHSLPFLYKILAEETGAKAWLALAPNHVYLKQHDEKDGWYNTELTSHTFPMDAWLMASGYVSKETIVSGIYMDTLSAKQNVVLCLVDLAKGYERKMGRAKSETFVLKCTDLALHHFPQCITGQLLRAETLRHRFERQKERAPAQQAYAAMEDAYTRIFKTGYREMPAPMYAEWLQLVQKEKAKYLNPTKH